MKILRKIIVTSSITGDEQVEKYICDKCGKTIKEVEIIRKSKSKNVKKKYSKLIYIDMCKKCKLSKLSKLEKE